MHSTGESAEEVVGVVGIGTEAQRLVKAVEGHVAQPRVLEDGPYPIRIGQGERTGASERLAWLFLWASFFSISTPWRSTAPSKQLCAPNKDSTSAAIGTRDMATTLRSSSKLAMAHADRPE